MVFLYILLGLFPLLASGAIFIDVDDEVDSASEQILANTLEMNVLKLNITYNQGSHRENLQRILTLEQSNLDISKKLDQLQSDQKTDPRVDARIKKIIDRINQLDGLLSDVFNTLKEKEERENAGRLIEDIIKALRNHDFPLAISKLSQTQSDSEINGIVKRVYDNQSSNFKLIYDFAENYPDRKVQYLILKSLKYEMETNGHMSNLVRVINLTTFLSKAGDFSGNSTIIDESERIFLELIPSISNILYDNFLNNKAGSKDALLQSSMVNWVDQPRKILVENFLGKALRARDAYQVYQFVRNDLPYCKVLVGIHLIFTKLGWPNLDDGRKLDDFLAQFWIDTYSCAEKNLFDEYITVAYRAAIRNETIKALEQISKKKNQQCQPPKTPFKKYNTIDFITVSGGKDRTYSVSISKDDSRKCFDFPADFNKEILSTRGGGDGFFVYSNEKCTGKCTYKRPSSSDTFCYNDYEETNFRNFRSESSSFMPM